MSDETEEIQALLDSVRRGDHEALASLYSHHRDRLRRMIAFRLDARLKGRISSSDIIQEVYIDVSKRLPHFQTDPDVPFFIWLRAVAVQTLIDIHRTHLGAGKRDAAREVAVGTIDASSEKIAEFMGDLTSPSLAAQRGELTTLLRQGLDQLDQLDREVLALRHFEDLSNHEVAALLNIKSAAASKRYIRALKRLKEILSTLPGFSEEPDG